MGIELPPAPDIKRWRRHLADERGTARVMQVLASASSDPQEQQILLELAQAEERHAQHWEDLLGDQAQPAPTPRLPLRVLAAVSGRVDPMWGLMLLQRAEGESTYRADADAATQMAADEVIHEEVLRGLAATGRERLSGNFRAAVFGANDGLVSNLALVVGMSATGVSSGVVLAAGVAGLLAGALSMGAGEYISVRSARELLDASSPGPSAADAISALDVDVNELALVYRARGLSVEEAHAAAGSVLRTRSDNTFPPTSEQAVSAPRAVDGGDLAVGSSHDAVGNAWGAAISSFCFFASGALIPIVPYLFGLSGVFALVLAAAMVGLALLTTGAVVGLLSGASTWRRALRQLAIGYGAATVTYLLGLAFGAAGVG
ncbi:MAG: VIT1/CCC1 transporter family protein [Ornithinimicrobium sp.]